ncbi:hypothetical protein NMZ58_000899 [Salmonella enterica]|nr:hypothetical protein [Salmonella enterica]
MKKIIASIVLSMGLIGTANANNYFACNTFSSEEGKISQFLKDGDRFYHAPSGEYRRFLGVKVRVNDDNSQFAFSDPVFDKTIKSPKLKFLESGESEVYGTEDKKFYISYDNDESNPLFYYKKGDKTYIMYGCREIL